MHTRDDPDVLAATPHRAAKVDPPAADVSRSAESNAPDARAVLELQRLAGNASVNRLIAREPVDETEEAAGRRSPVLDVVGGGGEPLAPDLRTEMEGRLGADFGGVRVHRDAAASESARSVDAHAYTVGNDVVFRSDRWDPSSSEGKRTLAHELTHVVQQAAGPVEGSPAPGGIRLSSPGDEFERAAERNADVALAGPSPTAGPAAGASAGPAAQLEAAPEEEELEKEELAKRLATPEEEELAEEEETAQGQWVQRQDEEEELEEEIPT